MTWSQSLIVGGTNVDDFPVEESGKAVEALEGNIKHEGIESFTRIVLDDDIVYMHLSHGALTKTL